MITDSISFEINQKVEKRCFIKHFDNKRVRWLLLFRGKKWIFGTCPIFHEWVTTTTIVLFLLCSFRRQSRKKSGHDSQSVISTVIIIVAILGSTLLWFGRCILLTMLSMQTCKWWICILFLPIFANIISLLTNLCILCSIKYKTKNQFGKISVLTALIAATYVHTMCHKTISQIVFPTQTIIW